MKSIDVKSLLIGFLLCSTFFLSIGARPASSGVGTYQIAERQDDIYMIDTRTGALYNYVYKRNVGNHREHNSLNPTQWQFITDTIKD